MKRTLSIFLICACSLSAMGQSPMESILSSVENNNTTLKALRLEMEAEKLSNDAEATLADPEFEFAYLWGRPSDIGARQDVSASQTFDYATLSGKKKSLNVGKNEEALQKFRSERMGVLLQAKTCILEIIYYSELCKVLEKRVDMSSRAVEALKVKLVTGECDQLEFNNMVISLSESKADLLAAHSGWETAALELKRLNGGEDFASQDLAYETILLPSDFESWAQQAAERSPALAYVRAGVAVSRAEVELSRAESMPSLSLGYSGEFVVGEHFQGISVGVSIPLWSASKKVQRAKAGVAASLEREKDAKEQFYTSLNKSFSKVRRLLEVSSVYGEALSLAGSEELLQKAFDNGSISSLDYFMGLTNYYDAVRRSLDAQRELQLAYAELTAFEL